MTMLTTLKMPSNIYLRFVIYAALIVIIGVCAFSFLQIRAEIRAKSFCNSIKIGSKAEGLLGVAADSGARLPKRGWIDRSNSNQMLLTAFTGMDPLYGYTCEIQARNGIVVSRELAVLDP